MKNMVFSVLTDICLTEIYPWRLPNTRFAIKEKLECLKVGQNGETLKKVLDNLKFSPPGKRREEEELPVWS